MHSTDWIQITIYITTLATITPILGRYMGHVLNGEQHPLLFMFGWLERLLYRLTCVNPNEEMNWVTYTKHLLLFNFFGFSVVFILQIVQSHLPLNPQSLPDVPWPLAFNTAVSFMTNTNWQAYGGEATLSYAVQTLGLTVQNFVSAATGISVFIALTRGIIQKSGHQLGNYWVDMMRTILYILLPISLLLAVVLMGQGVVQTFSHYVTAHTIEGANQLIPLGPAASQIAIKQIGTNGGGFFNTNSAHPFENPTALSNWLQMIAILMIPAALTYTYGMMVKSQRHGWIVFSAMMFIFVIGLGVALYGEYSGAPIFGHLSLMEGKEARFGITNSVLWSTATSAASNGSVNAMHSSLSPAAGGVALFNIMLGEIIFGGVGAGMYGMLMFVLMTVFLAGLMVGRSPEYMGKKIESREIGMVIVAILAPSAAVLLGSGIAAVLPAGLASLSNHGPHGLSEILYAFASASQNNGSAFAGLNANTFFYNISLGICMLIGRFAVIIPAMVIAGSLAKKNISPESSGTFSTNTALFFVLLIAVIVIVGALTFLPALSLGPIIEHCLMKQHHLF